jgi:H+/Cl- antiporter ClcA
VIELDFILPRVAIAVVFLAVLVPATTLFNPGKILVDAPLPSHIELLRMPGLLAIGIVASLFGPDCLALASGRRDWWDRVSGLHPSQQTLESSAFLFALYANEVTCAGEEV